MENTKKINVSESWVQEKLDEKGITLKPKQVDYLAACVNGELERVEANVNEYLAEEAEQEALAQALQQQLDDEKRSILSMLEKWNIYCI